MIESFKDVEGRILAYCEWQVVDKNGKIDKYGEYVYVNDIYIAPNYRQNGLIRKFINKIESLVPKANYVYWKREKYNNKKSIWRRFNITRRIK